MPHKIIERFCRNHGVLTDRVQGVMLHYDVSSSDAGGLAYLLSKEAEKREISYNFWISRKGEVWRLVPPGRRAWHAGKCIPAPGYTYRDANSAFVGVCLAGGPGEEATPAQVRELTWLLSYMAVNNGWSRQDLTWITGHNVQAWPRGRKQDPEGPNPRRPFLRVLEVRAAVREELARQARAA
jgi:N-acetyl-anhydromuramyl-L-alanine amidase AmpD